MANKEPLDLQSLDYVQFYTQIYLYLLPARQMKQEGRERNMKLTKESMLKDDESLPDEL